MIHDRVLDMMTDEVHDRYYDEKGERITEAEYELARQTTGYVCPRCGARTFGRFEPFVERGITAWCSSCGYSYGDKATMKAWIAKHPQEVDLEL